MAPQVPEPLQGPSQTENELGLSRGLQPVESSSEVVMLSFQAVQPFFGVATQMRLRLLRHRQEMLGVPSPNSARFSRILEPLHGELPDRLEHPEPVTSPTQEALVDERLHDVQVGLSDRFGGRQRAASPEHGQPGEQALLLLREQVVAPLDGRSKGSLSFRKIPRPAGQQRQALFEPLEDLPGRQGLRPGGRQLDGERQVIHASADVGDGIVGLEVRPDGRRPRHEQGHTLVVGQRRHRILVLARHVQGLAAGDQQIEIGAGLQKRCHFGSSLDDLLEVVEENEHRRIADVRGQVALGAEDLTNALQDQPRVAQRSKGDPPEPVRVMIRR